MADTVDKPEVIPLKNDLEHGSDIDPGKEPHRKRFGKENVVRALRENSVILATLVGIAVGFALGLGLSEVNPSPDVITWIGIPGEIFLRSLRITIVPLIVCLIINTTSSFNPRNNGKIAAVGLSGFFITQIVATVIAILLFLIFKPDVRDVKVESKYTSSSDLTPSDVFADLIRNIFPDNFVRATIAQTVTKYSPSDNQPATEVTNTTNVTEAVEHLKKSVGYTDGVNILGLVTICTTVGVAAHLTTPENGAFRTFFQEAQNIMMQIVRWLYLLTPVGVASLIAASMLKADDVTSEFTTLALLIGSVSLGLTIHLLVALPTLLFLVTRENPYTHLLKCAKPFMIGFATTSTSVALPDMLTSADKCGVSRQVASFIIPMSITLHADGASLYMTSSALFIAQITGSLTGLGSYVIVGVLAAVLGLAIPPVPSASIVCLVLILSSASIPAYDIAMLFTVEWLLDRLRSGVIAVSHVLVAVATNALCSSKLDSISDAPANQDDAKDTDSLPRNGNPKSD